MRCSVAALLLLSACGDDEKQPPIATRDSLADQQQSRGWGPDQCPALPVGLAVGYSIGDQLGDLAFKDCDGQPFDVREVCGADAVWLSFAHAWCPHCQVNAEMMEDLHAELVEEGADLASLNIVVEDGSFNPPTAQVCNDWRTEFQQSAVLTLYDDAGVSFLLWEESFTALNVVLNSDRIIRAKIHTDDRDRMQTAIESVIP
jgi:hypothetical protein